MKTIGVYRLTDLSPTRFRRLTAAQQEGARVWNCCMELHKQAANKYILAISHLFAMMRPELL